MKTLKYQVLPLGVGWIVKRINILFPLDGLPVGYYTDHEKAIADCEKLNKGGLL